MKSIAPILVFFASAPLLPADGKISYAREILPILSDKCFFCHGPDKEKQEGDLRLDIREEAIKAFAWDPENAADSEALIRIFSTDRKEVMPPPQVAPLSHRQGKEPDQDLGRTRRGIRGALGVCDAAQGDFHS